ncbi:DUF4232 domain-containing protein [Streptomyces endophyticus]|uniref:DUF4232 domain-containing protein n=1 Tax=Streptomyces endophyticus TaxID=714166 RepID=A0ABU6FCN5_9ACTN|nr:DUF4232 domain-containing protein [Streptomyces endophyticus]MEB8341744.1 DUF4232 domain-containing protein [Streptomyces endophyticus]
MTAQRTSRTRLLTAAATVALAALSLTACNDGTGVNDEGASKGSPMTSSSATDAPASQEPDASEDPAPAASKPAANAPASKTPASSGRTVTCQGSNTKTVAAPLTRPLNHMLLTVTNTGGNTCYLYGYPAVQFGEAQSVPPVDEGTKPQAVVTLKPGESGYASVLLSAADGSGAHGHTEKSLTVHFSSRAGSEDLTPARPSLPAEGLHIDDSLKVTYWQQSMDDAISW